MHGIAVNPFIAALRDPFIIVPAVALIILISNAWYMIAWLAKHESEGRGRDEPNPSAKVPVTDRKQ
jgi:hypothetical protein